MSPEVQQELADLRKRRDQLAMEAEMFSGDPTIRASKLAMVQAYDQMIVTLLTSPGATGKGGK